MTEGAPPADVTAAISCHTPFKIDGQPVTVAFALADEAATNTVMGLPFLRGTECGVFFSNVTGEQLVISKFGQSLPVFEMVPVRMDHPPLAGDPVDSKGAVFKAGASEVSKEDTKEATADSAAKKQVQFQPPAVNMTQQVSQLCDSWYNMDDPSLHLPLDVTKQE